jgi:hypothetical protein
MFASPVVNKEALNNHIVHACQIIHNCHGLFEWMQQSIMALVEVCIDSQGGPTLLAVTVREHIFTFECCILLHIYLTGSL